MVRKKRVKIKKIKHKKFSNISPVTNKKLFRNTVYYSKQVKEFIGHDPVFKKICFEIRGV